MTFHIFCPNPDPTPNVRQNHLVLYPVVLAECLSLYVFGRGVVVVFSLHLVLSLRCCLVVLDRYSRT